MTPTEINRAIAEACGWTVINDTLCDPRPIIRNGVETGDVDLNPIAELPNFHGSLDAMAEARKTLTKEEQRSYGYTLEQICWERTSLNDDDLWPVVNATAAQHAEAFLRAKGMFKESTP